MVDTPLLIAIVVSVYAFHSGLKIGMRTDPVGGDSFCCTRSESTLFVVATTVKVK